jgi:cytoskeletal protein RodZ
MDLSLELRDARERAGLSREEVSSRLNVQLRYIEALETDYRDLPLGAEREALMRAYARAIGLEPAAVIARAHAEDRGVAEIWLSGEVVIDEFPKEADLRPAPQMPPQRSEIHPPAPQVERARVPPAVPAPARYTDIPVMPPSQVEPLTDEPFGRRADRDMFTPAVPGRRGSLGVAAAALMAIVLAIFIGAYVKEATRPAADASPAARGAVSDASEAVGETAGTPEVVPAGRGPASNSDLPQTEVTTRQSPDTTAPTPRSPHSLPAPVVPQALPAPAAPQPLPSTPQEVTPPSSAELPPAPESPGTPVKSPRETGLAPPTEDLSGTWRFVTRVESSTIPSFEGLELGYWIRFAQNGNAIEGTGRKMSENGRMLVAEAQTPIVLTGTVAGDRLTITFTEQGARRRSSGRFVLVREDGAAWRGRFASDAARSSGTALAHRTE